MEKEFLLRDIAKLEYGNKFDKNKMTHNEPCYNFVGRTEKNNGITDFVDDNGTEPFAAGTITLAFGGSIGSTFIQPKPYYTSQNVGVITLPGEVSENAKIYFIKALEKVCKNRYVAFADEINKHFKTDLALSLPVIPSADPSHVYTPSDIDWGYMERCIAELEEERIAELEAYLQAAGLDDCELTPQDEQALAEEPPFAEFTCDELFELVNPRGKLTTRQLIEGKDLPYVAAKKTNNGVAKMCSKENIPEEDIMPGGAIVFVQQGDGAAGYTTYQPGPFYAISCVCCGYNENLNDKVGMYLMAQLDKNKALYSHSQSWNGTKIKQTILSLPVVPSADPAHVYAPADIDWGYMERYIRATEKLVMADVVAYKDRVIAETRRIVHAPDSRATPAVDLPVAPCSL